MSDPVILVPVILVIEDEPSQREILKYNLSAEGYEVILATDGAEGLEKFTDYAPDLVILDWMMPHLSGIEVCRSLRARSAGRNVPIIMLSARGEEDDKVRGLETGADDYVTKPYTVAELMARVKTQLRRSRAADTGQQLQHGDLRIDTDQHSAFRGEHPLNLGPLEYRLLATLMETPGRVWERAHLLDRVWGRDSDVEIRTVDVHIARLRKSLCKNGGDDPLRTVRGVGYALRTNIEK